MSPHSSRISVGPRFRSWALVAVVGALVVACSHADTVVQVQVQGGITGIEHLEATLTISGQTRMFMVPAQPRSIVLPTSFTVQIARSVQGQLDVGVDAFDGANLLVGHGSAALPSLDVGRTNQIVVDLTPGAGDGGAPDGGADGALDTSPGDTVLGGDGPPVDAAAGGVGGGAGASGNGGAGGSGSGGSGGSGTGGSGGLGSGGSGTGGAGTGGDSSGGGTGGAGGNGGDGNDDGGGDAPDA